MIIKLQLKIIYSLVTNHEMSIQYLILLLSSKISLSRIINVNAIIDNDYPSLHIILKPVGSSNEVIVWSYQSP